MGLFCEKLGEILNIFIKIWYFLGDLVKIGELFVDYHTSNMLLEEHIWAIFSSNMRFQDKNRPKEAYFYRN